MKPGLSLDAFLQVWATERVQHYLTLCQTFAELGLNADAVARRIAQIIAEDEATMTRQLHAICARVRHDAIDRAAAMVH